MSCEISSPYPLRQITTKALFAEIEKRPEWPGLLAEIIEARRKQAKRARPKFAPQNPLRIAGQVRFWDDGRKYGILITSLGDVFVHLTDLMDAVRSLEKDQLVTLEPIAVENGRYRAKNVKRAEL